MLGLIGALLLAWTAGASADYAWPLDLPQALTSSFAEYRPGRFHAGIDLRTGDIGKDVRAVADGYVSRVRCSPWGYGKAVYLTLTDGNMVVYGHLNDFYPALREYVRKAQHAQRNYTVDLTPDPAEFPVKRGDIVAKSGQTGVGVPHLHYEIRDPQGRPINPRLLGITWPDTTPPVIHKVLAAPQTPSDTINGDIVPVVLTARPVAGGGFRTDPIQATGRIGFGVDVEDPANGNANQLGVYILRTVAGENEVFRIRHDHISYDTIDNGIVSYHPFYRNQGRFLLQWRWPHNVSEIFQQSPGDGWFKVPANPVDIRIEAEDFLGNIAVVTVPVRSGEDEKDPKDRRASNAAATSVQSGAPKEPGAPVGVGSGQGTVRVDCMGDWLVLTATFSAPESESPHWTVEGDAGDSERAFRRVDGITFRAGYQPSGGVQRAVLHVSHPRIPPFEQAIEVFHRRGAARTVSESGASIAVKPDSPFGSLFLSVSMMVDVLTQGELTPLGPAYRVWPEHSPIDAPVEISLPLPENTTQVNRVHVYRRSSSGWSCEETTRTDGHLRISTRRLGTFAVMEDRLVPAISHIEPSGKGPVTSARPRIAAKVSDQGSGVVEVTVTCDGRWLLMAYDPERGVVEWEQDEDLAIGKHELVFRATDRAGNVTEKKQSFQRVHPPKKTMKKPDGKGP